VLLGAQKWGAPVLDERELSAAVVLCQPDHLHDSAAASQSICVPLSLGSGVSAQGMAAFNSAVSVTACLTLGDNLSVAGKIFTTAGTAVLLTDRVTWQFRLEVRPSLEAVCLFSALLACVLQYLTVSRSLRVQPLMFAASLRLRVTFYQSLVRCQCIWHGGYEFLSHW
jgi:hypothetical protein